MSESVQYQASFPAALTGDAGRRFTDYVYRHLFGWKMAAAVVVNLAGCVAIVLSAGWTAPSIALCAVMAITALYFAVNYVLRPGITSRRLANTFGDGATVTLRPEGFDLQVGARKMSRSWGRQRAILEFDDYFLLVILPTVGLVLPRQGMPEQGLGWMRAAMQGPKAKAPFPGL